MRAKAQGQSPWFLHGLDRQVRFGASDTAQFGPLEQRPPLSEAAIAWERLKDSGDIPTLEAFRKQYGSANPLYDRFAEQRIRELNEQQDVAVGIVDLPAPVPIEAKCEYIKIRLGTAQTACIEPGSGKSFRDCANCPEMVVVPVASFVMGSSKESESRGDDEGPQHQVTISKPFAVGKFEVTRAQFETFVRETGYPSGNRCWTNENGKFAERSERSYRNPGFSQADSHPVVCVNKEDAMSYVKWLNSKITGTTYRLLSEAEWEFVARATTKTPYFFGDDQSELCANGNGLDETAKKTFPNLPMAPCSDGYVFTSPVGSFSANRFGLHDVHGNAWEWAADCWHETYAGAPNDGSAWMGADGGECTKHVLRGGSWDNDPRDLRSAVRNWLNAGSRYNSFGFRVARSLSP
jgi:formylglycine-generating enzyme required for sulfatase activity